eukprot:jgi/Mesen1/6604/ME000338S05773
MSLCLRAPWPLSSSVLSREIEGASVLRVRKVVQCGFSRNKLHHSEGDLSTIPAQGNLSKERNRRVWLRASVSSNSPAEGTLSSGHAAEGGTTGTQAKQSHRLQPPVILSHIQPDDIRHPLDRQNTALLRALPGLDDLARLLLGSVAEQVMAMENLGTSILVSPKQLPRLQGLMQEAARILAMPAPDLYVRQSPQPNAYTLAVKGRRPFVVIHTALVELLSPAELQAHPPALLSHPTPTNALPCAVMAHELGHLKCDHGVWLTLANVLTLGAYSLPGLGAVLARTAEDALFRWLRAAELTCDRAALLVAQDPKVVVGVLMKLAGGSPSLAGELSVDAFLQQARSYDEAASSSPLAWYLRNAQARQLSHPLPVLRAREVDTWARSDEYKMLLERGRRSAPVLKAVVGTR